MSIMKFRCFCCGYKTLVRDSSQPTFEICPVCFWENDLIQNANPQYSGGANLLNLNQAKIKYKQFGAIEEQFIDKVRKTLYR